MIVWCSISIVEIVIYRCGKILFCLVFQSYEGYDMRVFILDLEMIKWFSVDTMYWKCSCWVSVIIWLWIICHYVVFCFSVLCHSFHLVILWWWFFIMGEWLLIRRIFAMIFRLTIKSLKKKQVNSTFSLFFPNQISLNYIDTRNTINWQILKLEFLIYK